MITDEQAREALEGAIQKWILIESGKGEDRGSDNCPLCKLYMKGGRCKGCPIIIDTGFEWCRKTPYDDWCIHHINEGTLRNPMIVHCEECRNIAHDMVKYLESLTLKW